MTSAIRPGLTPNTIVVLDAIIGLTTQLGRSPTYKEIAAEVGLKSKGAVVARVARLKSKGYVTYTPRQAYSIRVLEDGAVPAAPRLARQLQAKLDAYCHLYNEAPDAVIADAVALFIDQRERDVERDRDLGLVPAVLS